LIGLLFYFDDHDKDRFSGRHADIDLNIEVGKSFGFDTFILVDKSTSNLAERYTPPEDVSYYRFIDINESLHDISPHHITYVSPPHDKPGQHFKDPLSLVGYNHPKGDVLYCFGSNINSYSILNHSGDWLYLPIRSIWASSCISIVGYDRCRSLDCFN
jgi:hypothetical protein